MVCSYKGVKFVVKVEILSQNFDPTQKLRTANFSCVVVQTQQLSSGNACCLMLYSVVVVFNVNVVLWPHSRIAGCVCLLVMSICPLIAAYN